MDWNHVDLLWIIVMFLSVLWTFILTAPIHCIGLLSKWCDAKFLQIYTDEDYVLDGLRENIQQFVCVCVCVRV